MKKIQSILVVAVLALVVAFSSCSEKKSYTINGNVDIAGMAADDSIYAYMLDIDGEPLDSVLLADGKFQMKGDVDTVKFVFVTCADAFCVVVLEPGNIDVAMSTEECKASGTAQNDDINAFQTLCDDAEDAAQAQMEMVAAMRETNAAVADSLAQNIYLSYYMTVGHIIDSVYQANPANMVGVYIMGIKASSVNTYDELMDLLKDADPYIVNSPFIQQRVNMLKEGGDVSSADMAASSGIEDNQRFIDFQGLNSATGDVVRLSNYVGKGKPVLVDFWASWCGPCKAEVPNLIEINNKYKNQVVVLGVAVGDAKDDHLKAVKDLGINYTQIYDNSEEAATAYNIQTIPYIVLFDAQGNVFRQNMRGTDIEEAVKDVLAE